MLRRILYSAIKTTVAQVAVVALTWAMDYRYTVTLIDVMDFEKGGPDNDDTVH